MTDVDNGHSSEDYPKKIVLRPEDLICYRDFKLAETEPCPLKAYRLLIRNLPRPTASQIDNFVQFVSEAHSWYKHLPLLQPGTPFAFFLDPFSGYDRIISPNGTVIHKERNDDSLRFHYTWMKTEEYRSRFGYLSYSTSGVGTQIFLPTRSGVMEFRDLPVFSTKDGELRIPPEVANTGSVEITAIIHPYVIQEWVWSRVKYEIEEEHKTWPKESGGNATLQSILDIYTGKADGDPEELLRPERRRLQQAMTDAIYRMIVMVYDDN